MLENKKHARMSAHGENAKTEQAVMSKAEHVVQTNRHGNSKANKNENRRPRRDMSLKEREHLTLKACARQMIRSKIKTCSGGD